MKHLAWILLALSSCKGSEGSDAATDTDAEEEEETLAIYSVDPPTGPTSGGTVVVLLGRGFEDGAVVTFGSAAATSLDFISSGQITLVTPPGPEGRVDVTVENPSGASSTYGHGFTYVPEESVDWCRLQHPPSTSTAPSVPTELVYGRAFVEGCTETTGEACPDLLAQLGYGTGIDTASFTWVDAVYNTSFTPEPGSESNDEFQASLTVALPGAYSYAYRFSMDGASWLLCDLDGSDNGFQPDELGSLDVAVTVREIDWCNLQWPAATTTVATVPTEPIYGRVHVAGCTDAGSFCTGVLAQVGHGDPSVDPSASPSSYTWADASYNAGHTSDDDDEYSAAVTPAADGTFAYAYRFSGDAGESWTYCDLDGSTGGFQVDQMGDLTVGAKTIGWCNLQYPASTTTSAGTPTEDIYGRVYSAGCTDGAAYCGGILAEVGLGTSTDPSAFSYTRASYNPGHTTDDNDEYSSTLTPTSSGAYSYAYRFSGDAGASWTYCDTSGSSDGYDPADAGALTVP